MLAKFLKIHPFISKYLSPGNELFVFDLMGWKAGILITCYHVQAIDATWRWFADPSLWVNRDTDPTSPRAEFNGPKGRSWLMKWLPSRPYDNAMYVVFSNPIGMDDNQLKNGCSMILDPFGEVGHGRVQDARGDMAIAVCTRDKLQLAGGFRYRKARRPEMYGAIIASNEADLKVSWM